MYYILSVKYILYHIIFSSVCYIYIELSEEMERERAGGQASEITSRERQQK